MILVQDVCSLGWFTIAEHVLLGRFAWHGFETHATRGFATHAPHGFATHAT
jgi:hypothetical protein